jgi:hypothetical protein
MDTQLITEVPQIRVRRSARAVAVSAIAPLVALAGVVWAVLQPYRITLLHPRGESFWWLAIEPPLLVILVAAHFHLAIAPGLLRDLAEVETEG